jgi:hypothetical protein
LRKEGHELVSLVRKTGLDRQAEIARFVDRDRIVVGVVAAGELLGK